MKKKFVPGILLLVLGLMIAGCGNKNEASSGAGAESNQKTIIAATSGVSNPFSYDKDGKLTGYDVEVMKAIFEKLPEYKLEVQAIEFEGILTGLDNGRFQLGANNFSSNPERRSKYNFSLPIIENANVFVVRKDDNTLKSIEDLKGYKAVTEVGNSGATLLENYNTEHPDAKADIMYTEENFVKQFEGIEAGKYDVRIISRVSAEKAIKEHGFTNLKVVPFSTENSDPGSYILFSKSADSALLDAVNKRIKEMYNDGTLLKISEEQLGGDYLPKKELME
ncbi:transporter substrate-binding domain-containing protein [Paenibacillus barcinonensis]|uniref:transporter substrate-binding domain-containing protein n=1 Tax=Paenibacillus barcinonensis TaxID=198119 RepID=UPI001C123270|nr:transporter substrate-binding domain-containing protein [Paenibacillus barcinonensis]MBU5354406.1 transporter substrate-binding domain-containing protein [Paenibacillus barcinonensis]